MSNDMRQSAWWQAKRRAAAKTLPIICELCGGWVRATDRWDLDHVRPVALGGMYGPTRPVHASCNRDVAHTKAHAYRKWTVGPSRKW